MRHGLSASMPLSGWHRYTRHKLCRYLGETLAIPEKGENEGFLHLSELKAVDRSKTKAAQRYLEKDQSIGV